MGEISPLKFSLPATFQRAILGTFLDLIHNCVEVFMNYFSVYGKTFQEALDNSKKVIVRCQETILALNHEKCKIMFTRGVVIGHVVSQDRIEVEPTQIEVITNLLPP